MEGIKKLLDKYQSPVQVQSKITNPRQEIVGEFLEMLNKDRKPPYKPLTPARVGLLLRYIETSNMRAFLSECRYARNPAKHFWWCFKKAREQQKTTLANKLEV